MSIASTIGAPSGFATRFATALRPRGGRSDCRLPILQPHRDRRADQGSAAARVGHGGGAATTHRRTSTGDGRVPHQNRRWQEQARWGLRAIDIARRQLPAIVPHWGATLRGAWLDLQAIRHQGPFLAYEVVNDLRWTPVLGSASDVDTSVNAGPGCARGLGWVFHNRPERYSRHSERDQGLMRCDMRDLLKLSRDPLRDTHMPTVSGVLSTHP